MCITSLLTVIRTEFFVFKKSMRSNIRVLSIHACVDHTGLNINYIACIIIICKSVFVVGKFLCPVTGTYYATLTGKADNTRNDCLAITRNGEQIVHTYEYHNTFSDHQLCDEVQGRGHHSSDWVEWCKLCLWGY